MKDDEASLSAGRKPPIRLLSTDSAVPSKRKTRRRKSSGVQAGALAAAKGGAAAGDAGAPPNRALTDDETRHLQARLKDKIDADCLEAVGQEGGAVLLGGGALPEGGESAAASDPPPAPAGRKPRALFVKQCALNAAHIVQAVLAFGVLNAVVLQDVVMAPGEFRQLATELGCNRCKGLQAFCVDWTVMGREEVQQLGSALSSNTTLSALGVTQCSLGAEGAQELSVSLAENMGLTSLDISNNNIGAKGTAALFEALCINTRISAVTSSHNKLGADGACLLAPLLSRNHTLTSLHLAGNALRDAGVAALARALSLAGAVRDVNLNQNCITNTGAASLASHLPPSVDSLHLGRNRIGARGVAALARAVERGCGLAVLDMGYNQVDAKSAPLIARAAQSTKSRLQALILRGNALGDDGAIALSEAVASGRLTLLDLNSTGMGAGGGAALGGALCREGCRLEHLDIGWNAIGDAGAGFLAAALAGGLVWGLRTLVVNKNGVTGAGLFALLRSLSANTSLGTLHALANGATDEEREALEGMVGGCGRARAQLHGDKALAFMMASNARLGKGCLAHVLDESLSRWIIVLSETVSDRIISL